MNSYNHILSKHEQDRFKNFRDILDQKVKEYSSKFGQESICYFCFNFLVSINLFAKFGDELYEV